MPDTNVSSETIKIDGLEEGSAEYQKWSPIVQEIRDAIEGESAIKIKGRQYLKALAGDQEGLEFDVFKDNAIFVPEVAKGHSEAVSVILRKGFEELEIPSAITSFLEEDVDLAGTNFDTFTRNALTGQLISGNDWVEITAPSTDVKYVRDIAATNQRPYWQIIPAEQVLHYRSELVNNAETLGYFVKCYMKDFVDHEDQFGFKTKTAVMVEIFDLLEGKARVRTLRRFLKANQAYSKAHEYEKYNWETPDGTYLWGKGNKPLEMLPFVPLSGYMKYQKPVFTDAVALSMHKYKLWGELRFSQLYTGFPMWFMAGDFGGSLDNDKFVPSLDDVTSASGALSGTDGGGVVITPITDARYHRSQEQTVSGPKMGPNRIVSSNDPDAKVETIAFTGHLTESLKVIEQVTEYEQRLGSAVFAPDKMVGETEGAAKIRNDAWQASLASITMGLEHGLRNALNITNAWFTGTDEKSAKVFITRDFTPNVIKKETFDIALGLFNASAIDKEELLKIASQGEVTVSPQEELLEKLEALDAEQAIKEEEEKAEKKEAMEMNAKALGAQPMPVAEPPIAKKDPKKEKKKIIK